MTEIIGILGPGRLGGSLAESLRLLGFGVHVRGRDQREPMAAWATRCDVLMLTVRDDQLPIAVGELGDSNLLGKTVLMCSGTVPLGVLDPLAKRGAVVGKLHPLQAFTRVEGSQVPPGTPWAVEGPVKPLVAPWVTAWRGSLHVLSAEDWASYHLAAVFAANFLPLFIRTGARMLEPLAKDGPGALAWLAPLVQASVEAALDPTCELPFSGPAVRGDRQTLAKQYAALTHDHPQLAELYRLASEAIAGERDRLAER